MASSDRPLRVALLGSRGIPANYGGYETLMEELAPRLAEAGLDVTVYCRSHHTPKSLSQYRGVNLVVLPTIKTKHLDTPVHTLLSALHVLWRTLTGRRYGAALVVNGANAMFVPLLRLGFVPTALHVDGIERQRAKWGPFGRLVYSLSERLSCIVPTRLITDATVIERHYLELYDAPSTVIAYGVDPQPVPPGKTLDDLGLEAGRYILYVSRFEPENNPHQVVAAYRDVPGDMPLVMVGDAPYASAFIANFKRSADERVLFPGAIYGDGYRELLSNAFAYVQATEVGGTHPALVEGMGYGCCPIVNDTPENVEVAGPDALYFDAQKPETLTRLLADLMAEPERARQLGDLAATRTKKLYNWQAVTEQYLSLFRKL